MALEGLAAGVTRESVNGLLLARAPSILDEGSDDYWLFESAVQGAAAEVVPLIGIDPDDGPRRDLALRCVAFCAAAEIEYALFPEQQGIGDTGRGDYLNRRYEALRAQLAAMPDDDGPSAGETAAVGPRGSFPAVAAYPDPAAVCGSGWAPGFRRTAGNW